MPDVGELMLASFPYTPEFISTISRDNSWYSHLLSLYLSILVFPLPHWEVNDLPQVDGREVRWDTLLLEC